MSEGHLEKGRLREPWLVAAIEEDSLNACLFTIIVTNWHEPWWQKQCDQNENYVKVIIGALNEGV